MQWNDRPYLPMVELNMKYATLWITNRLKHVFGKATLCSAEPQRQQLNLFILNIIIFYIWNVLVKICSYLEHIWFEHIFCLKEQNSIAGSSREMLLYPALVDNIVRVLKNLNYSQAPLNNLYSNWFVTDMATYHTGSLMLVEYMYLQI